MSGSWTGGCPCKDCNFKTKNSYPLVNYIQNCNYESRRYMSIEAKEKQTESLLPLFWFCRQTRKCLHKGCDFRSTVEWDIIMHMKKCPLPWDDILYHKLSQSYPRWEQFDEANGRGKKLSSW